MPEFCVIIRKSLSSRASWNAVSVIKFSRLVSVEILGIFGLCAEQSCDIFCLCLCRNYYVGDDVSRVFDLWREASFGG